MEQVPHPPVNSGGLRVEDYWPFSFAVAEGGSGTALKFQKDMRSELTDNLEPVTLLHNGAISGLSGNPSLGC